MNNYFNFNQVKVPEVNGSNGANAYSIAPNSSVLLLDNNLPIVYLKQTDGAGYGTVTAFDLVPHKDEQTKQNEDVNNRLERMEAMLNEFITQQHTEPSKQSNGEPSNPTSYAIVQNERNDTKTNGGANGSSKRN